MAYKDKEPAKAASVRSTNKKNRGKPLLVVAIVLLILIILFSIGAIIIQGKLNKIRRADNTVVVPPDEVVDEIDGGNKLVGAFVIGEPIPENRLRAGEAVFLQDAAYIFLVAVKLKS